MKTKSKTSNRARTPGRPKGTTKQDHPELVIRIVAATYAAVKHRKPPYWIMVASLRIEDTQERIDMAVQYAWHAGLLQIGGTPAHSCTITPEGKALLAELGLA